MSTQLRAYIPPMELSPEGRRKFTEMTEKPPQPGAAQRRIDRLDAEVRASYRASFTRRNGTYQGVLWKGAWPVWFCPHVDLSVLKHGTAKMARQCAQAWADGKEPE